MLRFLFLFRISLSTYDNNFTTPLLDHSLLNMIDEFALLNKLNSRVIWIVACFSLNCVDRLVLLLLFFRKLICLNLIGQYGWRWLRKGSWSTPRKGGVFNWVSIVLGVTKRGWWFFCLGHIVLRVPLGTENLLVNNKLDLLKYGISW